VAAGAVVCLAACSSGSVDIGTTDLSAADAKSCTAFAAALPDSVGDQERRDITGDYGAAYGDPPILVLCGVPNPDELMTTCVRVNGVDWYEREPDEDGAVVAVTVGREPRVQLKVPRQDVPLDAEYVDVADAVKASTRKVGRCS